MRKKFDGQNIILIVNLTLILFLSYCSIPSKDLPSQPSQVHVSESVEHHDADVEEGAVEKEPAEAVAAEEEPAEAVAAEENTALEEHGEEVPEASSAEEPAAMEESSANEEKTVAEETAPAGSDSEMADIIAMDNPIYEKHKKGIVQFTHEKHVTDYEIGCGDCHHDDGGEPLADLKKGDEVVGCAECHSDPGKAPKSKDKKLSDSERLEYHREALHANCISCHKAFNNKNNTKDAPASCVKCHPKK